MENRCTDRITALNFSMKNPPVKLQKLLLLLLAFVSLNSFAVNQLFNYLGTGSNPKLHLELSANAAQWGTYSIDYQGKGEIPWQKNNPDVWSTWNVKDEKNNYYGTITLKSNGVVAWWDTYSAGAGGRRLDGIHFAPITGTANYQLTVEKIVGADGDGDVGVLPGAGPFPVSPLATPAVYPGTTAPVTLKVLGANIINDAGHSVRIKGMVRPSLEWNKQGQHLSPKDIQTMLTWGANTIRIDMNKRFWLDSKPASTKGSYKQIINAIVHHAIQHNMAVILDLHWVKDGGVEGQSPMASKDSIEFWTQVATDYQHFGTVMFELFNEPFGVPKEVWLNGGMHEGVEYAGYQALYDAVRKTGANNICIINGLDWGYDLSFVNNEFGVKGSNLVYGAHPYADKGESNWTGPGGSFDHNFKGILGKHPIIFTEFGDHVAADYQKGPNGEEEKYKKVYSRIIDFITKNNIHYTAFAWWVENGNPAFPALISDWDGTPVNGGVNIKKDMQGVPGTPINVK